MPKLSSYEHAVRALVYANSPEKQQRVTEEAASKKYLARTVMNASYGLVYRHPEATKQVLAWPYQKRGLDVIDFGRNSTVLRSGETVVKLARASLKMSPAERDELVEKLTTRHEISEKYLGQTCVEQTFNVIRHPLSGDPVVAAEQEYTQFRPFKIGADVDPTEIPVLAEFAEKSIKMEHETGFVSDISGSNNLGFDTENNLLLVDTIPLKASDGGASVALASQTMAQLADWQ